MMASNERFVRWQATTIVQFGFVNNLIIALATGVLGFAVTQVGDAFLQGGRNLLCLSIVTLAISVACGLGCAISRLLDFRETTKIARDKLDDEAKESARERVAGLGKVSWRLLYCQVAAFAAGGILLTWSFALKTTN